MGIEDLGARGHPGCESIADDAAGLHGGADTVGPPKRPEAELPYFPAGTERRVVPGVGHFMPREEPQAVVDALLKVLH